MHINDAVFLEDLCPKFRLRQWRKSIHRFTGKSCIYCGKTSESIDHVIPRWQGGLSTTENCVPACLSCNGDKSDENALYWYRRQKFYDPRRAMAIRAWLDGDLRLAIRLLQWANPNFQVNKNNEKDGSEYRAAWLPNITYFSSVIILTYIFQFSWRFWEY